MELGTMKLNSEFLAVIDFDEMSRREVISLSEALIEELEKTRTELSDSVRTEVDYRFALNEAKAINKKLSKQRSNEYVPRNLTTSPDE
jgi:hypothetical protein